MVMLNEILRNLESFGNIEYYARDLEYPNTAFKYLFVIDDDYRIKLKK